MKTVDHEENRIRTILLLRHAEPEVPDGRRYCLGSRTDVSASAAGLAAAEALRPLLAAWDVRAVFCSPMLRCRQSAAAIAGGLPVEAVPGLEELGCGAWDGLSFDDIRARWPEHYARREAEPALPPPGGEPADQAARRGLAALRALLAQREGNLAVVAHAGLNRAMLCALQGLPMAAMHTLPQPYLCTNILRFDGDRLTVCAVGRSMKEVLDHEETV